MADPDPHTPEVTLSPARVAAADAVRQLIHALVAREGDDAQLAELAAEAEALRRRLEGTPLRHRPGAAPHLPGIRADGAELTCVPDCMVAGPANPLSMPTRIVREGDEAVLRVTLEPGHEGLAGRAHGGIVASLFDEVMGQVLFMEGVNGFTAWLRVDYRTPVAVGVPIEIRARLRSREGRKWMVDAQLYHDGVPGPTAESLYVSPRPEPADA